MLQAGLPRGLMRNGGRPLRPVDESALEDGDFCWILIILRVDRAIKLGPDEQTFVDTVQEVARR
jgi:hypothetical protein